jgi:hypothetical protein
MTAVRIYRRRFPVSLSIVSGAGSDTALAVWRRASRQRDNPWFTVKFSCAAA